MTRGRPWTAEDDRTLAWLWETRTIDHIAQRLNRTPLALHHRAYRLGLGLGVPRGAETIQAASRRCGMSANLLRRILAFADVRQHVPHKNPHHHGPRGAQRPPRVRWLMPEDADRAVEAFLRTENITAAAASRGISRDALERRLWRHHRDEVVTFGREYRAPTRVIDAVCEELQRTTRRGPKPTRART